MGNLTPRRRKELQILYNRGERFCIDDAEMRRHVALLKNEFGITAAEIARRANVSENFINGHMKASYPARRDYVAAVMAVRPTIEELDYIPPQYRKLGFTRIVRGLLALGYGYSTVAPLIDLSVWSLCDLMSEAKGEYHTPSRRLYDAAIKAAHKLETTTPEEMGVGEKAAKIHRARNKMHPPITAWDLDTVHLPESKPEWTGACGTLEGYYLHYKHKIGPGGATCDRCKTAKSTYNKNRNIERRRGAATSPYEEDILIMLDGGYKPGEISDILGCHRRTIDRAIQRHAA